MTLLQGGSSVAPTHHPGIDTLAEYAAGQLRAGFDVVLAAHLRGCALCRNEVAQMEAVGGGLLETISPAQLDGHALAATLARLDEPAPQARPARSLDQLLTGARRRWIAPGIWIAPIDTPHDPETRVFLLRVGAGMSTAPHSHSGAEMTQVLVGALSDDGIIYRAGDMVELDQAHGHHPQVAGNEACICLFATQGRLKPTTLVGRVAFALARV
jgi:putative transcriptional regulator